jgi:ABC-2 type transport system ATP-binding protein
MTCIEIKGIVKSFAQTPVLRGIDCTVHDGSVHGFLGPNGSGKTTTIKTLLGLYRADEGEIKLFGETVRFGSVRPHLSHIGYLPQDPVFPEQYTGIEVMELVANLYGIPAGERIPRIKSLLKAFDLLPAGKKAVKNYSRGMKQRLGLASVWLPRPKLLILDEPVSALDPEGRYFVLEQIKEVKGESAVFFSSHILSDVERVSDYITIIAQGKVLLEDSMENIRGKYVSSAFLVKVPFSHLQATASMLRGIPGITAVATEENNLILQADSKHMDAIAHNTLQALLNAQIPILRFAVQEPTLEDVFLQLINGGANHETHATA